MKKAIKNILRKIKESKFSCILKYLWDLLIPCLYAIISAWWYARGHRKPSQKEAEYVRENVTFLYKSFERKSMAKRLYRNIQRFYPGAKVVIADDSKKPLSLQAPGLTLINLPFNSGLSVGLNRALEKVDTPYVFRMDDDELLTPFTQLGRQLLFLEQHPQVDLVSVQALGLKQLSRPEAGAENYKKAPKRKVPWKLLIPHMTQLDAVHYVVGKPPNVFLCRTEKLRQVGYDDRIRMLDHHEFFFRAAGILVSSMDVSAWVFHYHNPFDIQYQTYRRDYEKDLNYMRAKHSWKSPESKPEHFSQ